MKNKFFLLIPISLLCLELSAQTLVAGSLVNAGINETNNTASVISTLGGCPTCGTMKGTNGAVVPGFPIDDDNCFSVSFEFNPFIDDCGTIYDFFYTGNADFDEVQFQWDFGVNAFPQISNQPNPSNIAYATLGDKEITLRITDGDCDVTIMGNVSVTGVGFSANPILTAIRCTGNQDGAITIETNGGITPFSYNWSTGATTQSIDGLDAGDYSYTITDGAGCETVNIATLANPEAIMTEFEIIDESCKGDLNGAIILTVSGGAVPYTIEWSDNGSSNLERTDLSTGDYQVRIIDKNDCEITASAFVDEACDPRIFDTISPNGDNINDGWVVKGIENFPGNNVEIYNRWGELVYEKEGYTNDWAGTTTNGQELPAGAYYYVINYNNESNTVLGGSITIIR